MNNVRLEAIRRILDIRDDLIDERRRLEMGFWKFLPWNKTRVKALTQQINRIESKLFKRNSNGRYNNPC